MRLAWDRGWKGFNRGGAGGRTGFNRGRGRGYTEPGVWAGGRDLARDKGVRAEDLEQGGVICMLGYIPRDTNRDKTLYFSSVVYFRGASPAKCTKAWVCVFFLFLFFLFLILCFVALPAAGFTSLTF